jgi:hypothetical protein
LPSCQAIGWSSIFCVLVALMNLLYYLFFAFVALWIYGFILTRPSIPTHSPLLHVVHWKTTTFLLQGFCAFWAVMLA